MGRQSRPAHLRAPTARIRRARLANIAECAYHPALRHRTCQRAAPQPTQQGRQHGAELAASCNPGDHPAAAVNTGAALEDLEGATTSIDDRSGEMRLDSNGKPYTFDAFVEYYGERAIEKWDASIPVAAIATSPPRPSSPPRQPREEPPPPGSPNKRSARPAHAPTPSSPPKAAAPPATVAEVLRMTEAEVLAMEVAPPLHSSWEEDDELPADEELDTACPPCVVTTHHRRDASADASPPRSPSRKEGTPDATQVHRPVPAKQQQRAARVALEAATQLAEAAARLAQSPLGMATGGTCAASAYAPGAFTSLLSALPALVIFLTLMALIAALFGTAPPSRRRPRSTSAPPCIAAAASAAH